MCGMPRPPPPLRPEPRDGPESRGQSGCSRRVPRSRALRLADPGLYRAVANEIAGRRLGGLPDPDAPFLKMLRWMRKKWCHSDVRKHKAVRRWMYVHHGAHSALIALFGYGLSVLLLR